MRVETQRVQEGYKPENGQPRILPIYQSTTYKYDSAEHLGKLFLRSAARISAIQILNSSKK